LRHESRIIQAIEFKFVGDVDTIRARNRDGRDRIGHRDNGCLLLLSRRLGASGSKDRGNYDKDEEDRACRWHHSNLSVICFNDNQLSDSITGPGVPDGRWGSYRPVKTWA
jgi:hypothetical protein